MVEYKYELPLFPFPKQSTRKTTREENKQTKKEDPGIEAEVVTEASLITTHGNYEGKFKIFYLQLPRTDRQDA